MDAHTHTHTHTYVPTHARIYTSAHLHKMYTHIHTRTVLQEAQRVRSVVALGAAALLGLEGVVHDVVLVAGAVVEEGVEAEDIGEASVLY